MAIAQQIDQDLKNAMLAGDKTRVNALRLLKSVIGYEEVAKGKRESGLSEEELMNLLAKEAKKREESAELYKQGGDEQRTQQELSEKKLIEQYLPKRLSEEEISAVVDQLITGIDTKQPAALGQLIAAVKNKTAGAADGATIAKIVKEKLQTQ